MSSVFVQQLPKSYFIRNSIDLMPLPLLSLLLPGPTAQMLCLGVLHCGMGCPCQLWNVVLIKEDSSDRAGGGCGWGAPRAS